MSRTSNCIKMLQMLNSGRTIKISELSEILETNSRNIIEYRKELEDAGYIIITIPGKFGGYKLDKSNLFPTLHLSNNEKDIVHDTINYVMNKKDFVKKKEFMNAFGKITSTIKMPKNEETIKIIDGYQLTMPEKDMQQRYEFIENAINTKNAIEIQYKSIKNGLKTHILHPYKLFIYNNSWFFLAWNPEVGDVWTFKLNRIDSWKLLNENFKIWKYFKPENYLQDYNLQSGHDTHHIVYLAKGIRKHLISERLYGKNQKIEQIDDETIKVSVDMQNKQLIISHILSCGFDVKVLEPKWLIDEFLKFKVHIENTYE